MFTKEELGVYKKLKKPMMVQDFLNGLKTNFEEEGDTCFSPRMVLEKGKAHCIEGALFAASALRFHGFEPLILDLEANNKDYDHVVAVFKKDGCWGAISKTNHAVLRYREPIYKTIRELAMSFFHEYFTDDGKKTLRRYSLPVNLRRFDKKGWMFSEEEVWYIPDYLTKIKHFDILSRKQVSDLRKADEIEIEAGKMVVERDPIKREKIY
jgi:hypothetical protein